MSKDAYDVNTNTTIARAAHAGDIVNGIMSGAANKVQAREVNWQQLGLDPSIHGAEVQRLADMIVNDAHFDPSTYGTIDGNDESRATTERLLNAVMADDQTGATKGIMEIIDITKDFSRNALTAPPKNFLMRWLGKGKQSLEDIKQKYDTVDMRVNNIVSGLSEFVTELEMNTATTKKMEAENMRTMHATALKIAAGEVALNILVGQMDSVDENGNRQQYTLADHQRLHGLEKRLTDLKLAQLQREQQIPQFQMIINNNDTLAEKFRSVGSQIVPAWRSTITLQLTVKRQQQAVDVINVISKHHNELMVQQSEELRKANTDVARASEASLIDPATLRTVQDNLEASMTEVLQIQQEGSKNRARALQQVEEVQQRINKITTGAVNEAVQRVIENNSTQQPVGNVVSDTIDSKVKVVR